MNLQRAIIGTLSARVIGYGLTMVTGIFIARLLGPTDRGIYAVLGNTAIILQALGN